MKFENLTPDRWLFSAWLVARGWPTGVWLTLILGLHTSLLAWSAVVHSPTMDEPFHLAGGVRHWKDGRFDIDRGNPPLVGGLAAIPVVLAGVETDWHRAPNSFLVGSDFLKANGSRVFWLMTLARWVLLPISVGGVLICYWWGRELGGDRVGLVASALWAFNPQIIAYGSLVTGDVSATVFGLATAYAFWKWLRQPTWERAFLAGLVWGLAELSKFVWLLLYPLLPLLWLLWRWRERRERPWWKTVRREFWQGLLMVVLSLDVLNLGYVFTGFGQPFQDYQVSQKVLSRLRTESGELRTLGRWLGACPVPLPSDYMRGLDEITQFVSAKPSTYLRGEYRPGGWWYFYLYALAVKLPLGTLGIFLLAMGVAARRVWRQRGLSHSPVRSFPFAVACAVFVFVTMTSGVQFVRYMLPVVPLLVVWSSQELLAEMPARWLSRCVALCLAWTMGASLLHFPHSLSYFNELAGGSSRGDRHLIDDSLDWGQDLLYLRQWLDRHPEARPLKLAYWGWTDPRSAGIEFELPPRCSDLLGVESTSPTLPPGIDEATNSPVVSTVLVPGWYAVSIGLSHGGPWIRIHDGAGHETTLSHGDFQYFRDLEPTDRVGYSIQIFHIDEVAAKQIRASINSFDR